MWISSGDLFGEVRCFCNYMLEEIQWRKAQYVHSCEFFHGPLEVVDQDISFNIVINRDSNREIDLRVANFIKSMEIL